jgi:DNA-binding transcriptional regulator YhcF (GntR family)
MGIREEDLKKIDGKVWLVRVRKEPSLEGINMELGGGWYLVFLSVSKSRGKTVQVLIDERTKLMLEKRAKEEERSLSSLLKKMVKTQIKEEEIPLLIKREKQMLGDEKVSFQLKREEFQRLSDEARKLGLSLSQYIRMLIAKGGIV